MTIPTVGIGSNKKMMQFTKIENNKNALESGLKKLIKLNLT